MDHKVRLLLRMAGDELDWKEQSYIDLVHTAPRVVVVVVLETLQEKGCFASQVPKVDLLALLETDSKSLGMVCLCLQQP